MCCFEMHGLRYIWLRPGGPPPRYPVMYSYTSISNGRHGVFSPPPPPPLCGIPFPTAAVLCSASCGIPSPHPCGFVVFQLCVRAREEGDPPPLWNRMVFPFAIHTHTTNPPPVEQDGFPFCSETHTHTHTPRVCVCMAFSLRTCSSAKPPFHSLVWGQSTYDTGCGTPVVGVLQASRLQALVFGGDTLSGGGGDEGGVRGGPKMHSAQP